MMSILIIIFLINNRNPFACSKIRPNLFSTAHGCIILTGLFDFLGTTFCTVGYIYTSIYLFVYIYIE